MWYSGAKERYAEMVAEAQSIPPCGRCGSSLKKSGYADNYYCPRCYAQGYVVEYWPDSGRGVVKQKATKQQIYSGPYADWGGSTEAVPQAAPAAAPPQPSARPSPQPTPTQTPTGEPVCKIHGIRFSPSKYNQGQGYCAKCWHNGQETTYDQATDHVTVKDRQSKRVAFDGTYDEWQGQRDVSDTTPTPKPAAAPAARPEPRPTEAPRKRPAEEQDQTDVAIESGVTAVGDYANGQPEGDLVVGQLRIFSDEHRAEIPIDTESIMTGVGRIASRIEPGMQQYVQLQDFLYLAASGDERFRDIHTSPVILDTAEQDPEAFCQQVATQNPLYRFTEIGARGHTPNISQANAIEVISTTPKNLILCFPTGAGKTACAEAAIAKGLSYGKTEETAGQVAMQDPVAVYICPARALAAQVAKDFSSPDHPFAQSGWKVRIERGVRQVDAQKEDVNPDEEDTEVGAADDKALQDLAGTDDPSIIVATPERLLSCLMNPRAHDWVSRISTMVFDEGHLLGDESRGAKFEGEQIHLYRDYYRRIKSTPIGAQASIVFMSATMQNALELSAWQGNATEDEDNWSVVWGEYKPVPIVQEFRDYEVSQDRSNEDQFIGDMLSDIVSDKNYCMKVQKDGTQARVMRPTLVFFHVKRRAYAMQRVARDWFRECTNPQCGYVFETVAESGGRALPAEESRCPICRSKVAEFKIDFHHAGESSGNQQRYVQDFNSGKRKVLAATSTLAAGVNTGAMSVYIGGTARGPQDVSASDIGQMRGRAGRQSFAFQYPDQPARVVIYTEKDRSTYHRRRIQAGAYLESMMADPIHIVDNLLRAVRMGSVRDFEGAGRYIGSSLAYFQAGVDNVHRMNVRQALKEVSRSIDPTNADRVVWITVPDKSCPHGNIGVDEQSTRESIEGDEGKREIFDWHLVCRDCGAEGLMEQEFSSMGDMDFVKMTDSALRDLVGAGFLVVMPDGTMKITNLGKDIVRSHMESATAVDIVRNMVGFDARTASPMDLSMALGNVRANNDERRGCYISKDQATACEDVLQALGLTPETAFPAVKNIQCLLWSLSGVTVDEVPDSLRSDFMSVPDTYGGPFLNGFGSLAKYAGWFQDAGDMLSMVGVQLRKQVSPRQVPFAVVHMIGAVTASALERAGFNGIQDVVGASDADVRWGDFCYYKWKWDKKGDRTLPSADPRGMTDWMRSKSADEARKMRQTAKMALEGKKFSGKDASGKPRFERDNDYARQVEMLNSDAFLTRVGMQPPRRQASQDGGWYRSARDSFVRDDVVEFWP